MPLSKVKKLGELRKYVIGIQTDKQSHEIECDTKNRQIHIQSIPSRHAFCRLLKNGLQYDHTTLYPWHGEVPSHKSGIDHWPSSGQRDDSKCDIHRD